MSAMIGVPKEVYPGERRVAVTPETARQLIKMGFSVTVEAGAGAQAQFSDEAYQESGARITDDIRTLWSQSDVILKVRAPDYQPTLQAHETDLLKQGAHLLSFIWPGQNPQLMTQLQDRDATVLAMDCVPRITRSQKMDALSSVANISGYRAVIEAANQFGRFFTGQITAAGKIPPAKVLVIGAGVAGLSAIGAANSLGAIVRGFDTRPEVEDQVASMGAEFLLLDFEEDGTGEGGYAKVMSDEFIKAEMELFARQAMEVDIIITTALIPGKRAPELITAGMVESMQPGSVIVDLAAEQGGNCALTRPGEVVVEHGVTIIGYTDLPSRLPTQSSQLYATNLKHLLDDLCPNKDGKIHIDMEDEVIRGTTVIKNGVKSWPPPPPKPSAEPPQHKSLHGQPLAAEEAPVPVKEPRLGSGAKIAISLLLAAVALFALGAVAPPSFMQHFTVFVLSCFVGWQVVWNVTPALHTPLMSVTNAISGIIVIGALLQMAGSNQLVTLIATVAILVAAVNISGGFLVTQRMLKMFTKEES